MSWKSTKKPVRIPIKRDLRPDNNPFDYAIWGVLENKTNATSHTNIGSLKTAIEKERNKMLEEFILKACKSFRRHVDTVIEKKKWWPCWVNLLFCVFLLILLFIFLKLKLILFYIRVIYYDTRIFLILLPHPDSEALFWRSREYRVSLHGHYSRFHSDLEQ